MTGAQPTRAIPKQRWGIGLLLGAGVLVNYFDRINLSVAAPQLKEAFDLSSTEMGLLFSAFFWTYALLQIPIGVILDRFGVTRVGRWGAFLWGVASTITTFAGGFGGIFAARALLGVAEAPAFPVSSKATGYWFPRRERAMATAIFDAAAKFSNVIGVPLIALAVVHLGWRWGFGITAILSYAYFLVFYLVYRDPSQHPTLSQDEHAYIVQGGGTPEGTGGGSPAGMLGYLLRTRKVWGLTIGFAAYGYSFYLFLTWLPGYLVQTLHMSILQSATFAAIPWVCATIADLAVGGWLIDHLIARGHDETRVRKGVLLAGMFLGLAVFGATTTTDPWVAIAWISLALSGLAAAAPVGWSLPSLIAPRGGTGTVGGIMNFANNMMGAAAPIVTGYLVGETRSFSAAFVVAGVVLLVGMGAFVFLLGRIEPIPDPEEDPGVETTRRATTRHGAQTGRRSKVDTADVGVMGLGVMGRMLALNMERNGFRVAGIDLDPARMRGFADAATGRNLIPCATLEGFLAALDRPRRILMMVPAGAAVDAAITALKPALAPGDVLMDGGNTLFSDTERRSRDLESAGIIYIGTGVSGGEEGALWGPAIMPGGQPEAWELVKPLFEAIAARAHGEPCVAYMGPRGAGHFVKMVHNGIEYGDMQLIAEAYDILHRGAGFENHELHEVFSEWNRGELESYLIEITAAVFATTDPETGTAVVDLIVDEAQQKGTGKWMSQSAFDLGVPTPTVNAAVESRILSSYRDERRAASRVLMGPDPGIAARREDVVRMVREALYAAKICSYAQGFALMSMASREYGYQLDCSEIARIWRGGCIIRAQFLDCIRDAFSRNPRLTNLMMDSEFAQAMNERQDSLRRVVSIAALNGIPVLAFASALSYYDAYRSERLPANLTQAQRDYFGAHTYRRVDREGAFHTQWLPLVPPAGSGVDAADCGPEKSSRFGPS